MSKLKSAATARKSSEVFKCSNCSKVFGYVWNLRRHVKLAHYDRSVKLKRKPADDAGAAEVQRRYKCSYCHLIYNHYMSKIRHEKLKHKNNVSVKKFKNADRPNTFTMETTKEMREGKAHLGRNKNEPLPIRFKCAYCPETFSREATKNIHEGRVHFGRNKNELLPKWYKCTYCISTFKRITAKNIHEERMHSGQNTFFCDLCNSWFNKKSSMDWHKYVYHSLKQKATAAITLKLKNRLAGSKMQQPMKTTNVKKVLAESTVTTTTKKRVAPPATAVTKNGVKIVYANELCCSYCPMFFKTTVTKEIHERRHIGERYYKCRHCSASFFHTQDATSHELECSQLPHMSWCQFCDFHTMSKDQLERHYTRKHGLKFQSDEELEFYRREIHNSKPASVAAEADSDETIKADYRMGNSNDEVLSNFDDDSSSESEDEFELAIRGPVTKPPSEYFEHAGKSGNVSRPPINRRNRETISHRRFMLQIDRLEENDCFETASPEITKIDVPIKVERAIYESELLESNYVLGDAHCDDNSQPSTEDEEPIHDVNIKTEMKYSQMLSEPSVESDPLEDRLVQYEVEVARLNSNLIGIFQNNETNESCAVTSGCEGE